MKSLFFAWLTLAVGLTAAPSPARDVHPLYDLNQGSWTTLEQALPRIMAHRAVLVGEHHNRMSHHQAQLAVIRALHKGGARVAVGLEMFRTQSQPALDQWVSGRLDKGGFQRIYEDNWNFPWPLYAPIFGYARKQGIPLIGLNIPSTITRQVSRRGFHSLSPLQRNALPAEVTCEVDEHYMAFIRRAHSRHAHGSLNFRFFCEAQLLWDTAMALNVSQYLEDHPLSVMVVLAGTGHAWKQGIPEQLRQRSRLSSVVILPMVGDLIEPGTTTERDSDYIMAARGLEE